MEIAASEARDIVYGENPGWKEVSRRHTGEGRWEQYYEIVLQHGDKFFAVQIAEPSTEMQDGQDIFRYRDPVEFVEVREVETVVKVWEPVDEATEKEK